MKAITLKQALQTIFISSTILCSSILFGQSPGGVSSNIQLWLKANDGALNSGSPASSGQSVNTWQDKSTARTNDATDHLVTGGGSTTIDPPTYHSSTTHNVNYNPVVTFDGMNDGLDFSDDFIYSPGTGSENGMTWLALIQPAATTSKPLQPIFDFGAISGEGYGLSYGSSHYGIYTPTSFGGAGDFRVPHSFATQPALITFKIAFGDNQTFAVNGSAPLTSSSITGLSTLTDPTINQAATHGTSSSGNTGPFTIGRQSKNAALDSDNGRFFSGNIAELIGFSQVLSAADLKKVASYLAMKYSITLDNTGGGTTGDYVSSTSALIWDASNGPGYHNQVIGIGRDDNSALNQKQSHQVDDLTRLYISTRASDNASNTGQFITDRQFVIMGNNGGEMKSTGGTEYPSGWGIFSRIDREWKVTKTAYPGQLTIDFKLNTSPVDANNLLLLVDDDGDFSDGGTLAYGDGSGVTISVSGTTVTVSNISSTELPISGTRYITLASTSSNTPLSIELGDLTAFFKGDQLIVNWNTLSETNNDYFEIEASKDGKQFFKIGQVASKAKEGNSSIQLNYTFSIVAGAGVLMSIAFLSLTGLLYKRRSKLYFLFAALGIAATLYACTRSSDIAGLQNDDLYIRIAQVDKDGGKTYYKTIKAIK